MGLPKEYRNNLLHICDFISLYISFLFSKSELTIAQIKNANTLKTIKEKFIIFILSNNLNEKYSLITSKIKLTPTSINFPSPNAGLKVYRIVLSHPTKILSS